MLLIKINESHTFNTIQLFQLRECTGINSISSCSRRCISYFYVSYFYCLKDYSNKSNFEFFLRRKVLCINQEHKIISIL